MERIKTQQNDNYVIQFEIPDSEDCNPIVLHVITHIINWSKGYVAAYRAITKTLTIALNA